MTHQKHGNEHVGVRVIEKARLDKAKAQNDVSGYDQKDLAVVVCRGVAHVRAAFKGLCERWQQHHCQGSE